MANRKDRQIGLRLLSSLAAFLLIGVAVYILMAGMTLYAGVVLAASVLALAVPSVSAGESFLEMITGFFELFLDGVMEVIGGIAEAIASLFG